MATPTYTLIDSTTLSSAANNVTFTSIPTDDTCKDLIIVMDGSTASGTRPVIQFNGITTSSYSSVMMADDAGAGYSTTIAGTYIDPIPGFSVSGKFSAIWQVMDSNATDKNKSVLIRLNQHDGAHVHATAGRWANNDAVVSVKILTSTGVNYSIGTTFYLYKIAG